MDIETPEPGDTLESTVRPVLAQIARAAGMQSVYLTEVNWAAARQSIVFAHNERGTLITEGVSFPWSNALCRRALIDGPAYSVDPQRDWPGERYATELDLHTFISIPVFTSGDPRKLLGTLCAVSSDVVVLGPETRQLMRTAAEQMGRDHAALPTSSEPAAPPAATPEEVASLGADLARAIGVIQDQRAELERLAGLGAVTRADPLGEVGIVGAPATSPTAGG